MALPVSLAELLEVRGQQGLTGPELRAVAAQTCRHLGTLLETDGHVGEWGGGGQDGVLRRIDCGLWGGEGDQC